MKFEYNCFITSTKQYDILLSRDGINTGTFKRSIRMNLYLNKDIYIYSFKLDLEKLLGYELVAEDMKIQIIVQKNKLYTMYSSASNRKRKIPIEKVNFITI